MAGVSCAGYLLGGYNSEVNPLATQRNEQEPLEASHCRTELNSPTDRNLQRRVARTKRMGLATSVNKRKPLEASHHRIMVKQPHGRGGNLQA